MRAQRVRAIACVHGGESNPGLQGRVEFTAHARGTLVTARLRGLPDAETGFFAFHIHEGCRCGGEDFSDTGSHYNPSGLPHPQHAGDLPPLLSCGGEAYLSVLTDRFRVSEVIGRTVVIHSGPDDFHSQPAGNAGRKIACGVICAI